MEHQFVGDFSVQEFNAEDFQIEHEKRLNEINGQWMEETNNISLWLSQGCYISGKCLVEGIVPIFTLLLDLLSFFKTWQDVKMLFLKVCLMDLQH